VKYYAPLTYLLYHNFNHILGQEVSQELRFTGTPLTIFNTNLVYGLTRSIDHDCNISSFSSFNTVSGKLALTYSNVDYLESTLCKSVFVYQNLVNTFFTELYTPPYQIELGFDVRTAITALSVFLYIFYS